MTPQTNVSLARYTTFGIGGSARYFVDVFSEQELQEALEFARGRNLPIFSLGEGSNILVSDEGFPGLVIRNQIKGMTSEESDGNVLLTAGAGELWDAVVAYAVQNGWAGIECLSGIPGLTGAAPVQNIGAYGQELSSTLVRLRVLDQKTGEVREFTNEECGFSYRDSIFKSTHSDRYVITRITLALTPGGAPRCDYRDSRFKISDFLKDPSRPPTLPEVRDAVIQVRAKKGMVIAQEHESYQSAGSFFKAPIVSKKIFKQVSDIAEKEDKKKKDELEPWHWDMPSGEVKIAPAFLLEYTPFHKGYREGNVGISPKHSLSLINLGGGTAKEMLRLATHIRDAVEKKFGILLESEVRFIGFKDLPAGRPSRNGRGW